MQTVCVLCGESMASPIDYDRHLELTHGLLSDDPTAEAPTPPTSQPDGPSASEAESDPIPADAEPDREAISLRRLEPSATPAPAAPAGSERTLADDAVAVATADPDVSDEPVEWPPRLGLDSSKPVDDEAPAAARDRPARHAAPSSTHSGIGLVAAFAALVLGIAAGMFAQRIVSPERTSLDGDLVVATDAVTDDHGFVLESLTLFPAPDGGVAATATVANIAPDARSAQWEIELYSGDRSVGTLRAEGVAVGPNQRLVAGFLGAEGMTAVPDRAVLRTLFVT